MTTTSTYVTAHDLTHRHSFNAVMTDAKVSYKHSAISDFLLSKRKFYLIS